MSKYTGLAKIKLSNGQYAEALMCIALGVEEKDPASILVAHYLQEESEKYGHKEAVEKRLMGLLEKYGEFSMEDLAMSEEEFARKKDSLSEMLYIRYIYMAIEEGTIKLDASNYLRMKDSVHGFRRFLEIIDKKEDKAEFESVMRDNKVFLDSIKKNLFGSVSYDKYLLKTVNEGITRCYQKEFERLAEEQRKEVEEGCSIHYRIGSVLGGGFTFTSD